MSHSRCLALVFSVLSMHFGLPDARAEVCSPEPTAEEGGLHRCYAEGRHGRIHVWTPDGFDAKTAVTVVYVHGFNLGDDHCPDTRYLDCAWDAHALALQFAKSGQNAMFIAVEGPVRPGQRVQWTSLDELLRVVHRRSGIVPPTPVMAVAHSAGIYTVMRFLGDTRLRHVVALDALYLHSSAMLERWYRTSASRRLTLIGAASRFAQTSALGRKLSCAITSDIFGPYLGARCVAAVDPEIGHMELIRDGRIMPAALARMSVYLP